LLEAFVVGDHSNEGIQLNLLEEAAFYLFVFKKLLFCGTGRFITKFTTARHWHNIDLLLLLLFPCAAYVTGLLALDAAH
jgi:hypothetical protein